MREYDTLDRITQADYGTPTEDFAYDLPGNRTSYTGRDSTTTTYTSNTANQYTAVSPGRTDGGELGCRTIPAEKPSRP